MTHSRTRARRYALAATSVALATVPGACAQDSVKEASPTGSAADSEAGIADAPRPSSRPGPVRSPTGRRSRRSPSPGRPRGKNVHIVALGDQIPVIHGVAVGIQDAMTEVGATYEDL